MTTESKAAGKSKTTAVVMALFLSFWSWLYTYKKDAWKFWVGIILIVVVVGVNLILTYPLNAAASNSSSLAAVLGMETWVMWLVIFAVWVWAFLDAVLKKTEWYRSY